MGAPSQSTDMTRTSTIRSAAWYLAVASPSLGADQAVWEMAKHVAKMQKAMQVRWGMGSFLLPP